MFTIEVLIALFVLFLTITLSATASKFFNQILSQQERYRTLYISVFNIKDKISNEICSQKSTIVDRIDNISYEARCVKIKESRTLVKNYDWDSYEMNIGHTGRFTLQLYKVNLIIPEYQYQTSYYITRYLK